MTTYEIDTGAQMWWVRAHNLGDALVRWWASGDRTPIDFVTIEAVCDTRTDRIKTKDGSTLTQTLADHGPLVMVECTDDWTSY